MYNIYKRDIKEDTVFSSAAILQHLASPNAHKMLYNTPGKKVDY